MLRKFLGKLLEDNPWGVIVFFFVAALGAAGGLANKITLADYLGVVAAAGGLLGLGHSVHRGAKHLKSGETNPWGAQTQPRNDS